MNNYDMTTDNTVKYPTEASLGEAVSPDTDQPPALKALYVSVMLFWFLYFVRPEDYVPALAVIPFAKLAGLLVGITLFGGLLTGAAKITAESKLLLGLFAYLCLGVPLSKWPGGSYDVIVVGFSKMVLAVIATAVAANTLRRLRGLLLLHTAAMLLMAGMALSQPRRDGRMWGVGNMFTDPNDFALLLVMVLPVCLAMMIASRRMLGKLAWLMSSGVLLFAIISTGSRGGFLALIALSLAVVRRFRIRVGFVIVFMVILGIAFAVAGGAAYFSRMSTITDTQSEDSSAARREILIASVKTSLKHPLFGVGAGQFTNFGGAWHQTHNSYTQLSSEGGIPALILFCAMIRLTFKNLRVLNQIGKGTEFWYLGTGIYCGFWGYLVGAFFLSTAFWPTPYLWMVYGSIMKQLVPGSSSECAVSDDKSEESVGTSSCGEFAESERLC